MISFQDYYRVSILARLYRRALPLLSRPTQWANSVSILARLYRRALRCVGNHAGHPVLFQSSPAFTGGRFLFLYQRKPYASGFNPRPPLQAGASMRPLEKRLAKLKFQSSPAFTGGRFARSPKRAGTAPGFNPRPPLQAGASRVQAQATRSAASVSILARLYRRALPGTTGERVTLPMSFNPRPPLQAGASANVGVPERLRCVSILARLYRRALPGITGQADARAGRFNPRPPLQAGASQQYQDRSPYRGVSILARLYRRALPALTLACPNDWLVFQSSPAFTGGRFPGPAHNRSCAPLVSILARLYRRALR